MKTLVEQIRDMVSEARTRGMYPVLTDVANDILGRSCWSEKDEAELFTAIADRIEREYLPRDKASEWRDIEGYEGIYQVSSDGLVRSLDRKVKCAYGAERVVEGRVLKPFMDNHGYERVKLSKNNIVAGTTVHKLVANAFIDKPEGAECVNHIDGCKTNNHVSNLEWCTLADNNRHAFETGLNKKSDKDHIDNMIAAHLAGLKKVVRDDGVVYASASEADRAIGASRGCVAKCLRGLMPTVKGHSFRWLDEETDERPEPEVLDADGVPIKVGDVVYFVDSAEAFDVLRIESDGEVHIGRNDGTSTDAWVSPGDLTHKQPDTLERIDEDAKKELWHYWGCSGARCAECPALIDGKTPKDYYHTDSCEDAKVLDLLHRQRELLESGQE